MQTHTVWRYTAVVAHFPDGLFVSYIRTEGVVIIYSWKESHFFHIITNISN